MPQMPSIQEDLKFNLTYDTTYKLIICKTCQAALNPQVVPRHVIKHMNWRINKSLKEEVEGVIEGLDVQDQEGIAAEAYNEDIFILGVEVFSGLTCPKCYFCCVSQIHMNNHVQKFHSDNTKENRPSEAKLQSILDNRGTRRYFRSVPPRQHQERIENTNTLDEHLCILKEANISMATETNEGGVEHTRSDWMTRTGWHKLDTGKIKNGNEIISRKTPAFLEQVDVTFLSNGIATNTNTGQSLIGYHQNRR